MLDLNLITNSPTVSPSSHLTYPSSQCCLSLLVTWWLCLCRGWAGAGGLSGLSGLSSLRSVPAASSFTASRRCALELSAHSRSSSDRSKAPPPPIPDPALFCTTLQVQSRVSTMSSTFLLASLTSWPFFFTREFSSATASYRPIISCKYQGPKIWNSPSPFPCLWRSSACSSGPWGPGISVSTWTPRSGPAPRPALSSGLRSLIHIPEIIGIWAESIMNVDLLWPSWVRYVVLVIGCARYLGVIEWFTTRVRCYNGSWGAHQYYHQGDLTMCNVQTNPGPQLDAQVKMPQYGSTLIRIIGAKVDVRAR